MCTLIVLDRVVPGLPLVVASNRDEYLSRPAAAPAWVISEEEGHPAVVSPQDLEAGGTWMGLNARGLFVGLTNRHTQSPRRTRRSRGLLVRDTLQHESAQAAARERAEDPPGMYNPFHLFYGDGSRSFETRSGDDGLETRELQPGIRVIGNRDPDDPASGKLRRIRAWLDELDLASPFEALFAGLAGILSSHVGQGPLEHVCIHTADYGTRSSAILALGPDRWRYWHAEGAPCEAKYRNYTRLLDDLRQGQKIEEGL